LILKRWDKRFEDTTLELTKPTPGGRESAQRVDNRIFYLLLGELTMAKELPPPAPNCAFPQQVPLTPVKNEEWVKAKQWLTKYASKSNACYIGVFQHQQMILLKSVPELQAMHMAEYIARLQNQKESYLKRVVVLQELIKESESELRIITSLLEGVKVS